MKLQPPCSASVKASARANSSRETLCACKLGTQNDGPMAHKKNRQERCQCAHRERPTAQNKVGQGRPNHSTSCHTNPSQLLRLLWLFAFRAIDNGTLFSWGASPFQIRLPHYWHLPMFFRTQAAKFSLYCIAPFATIAIWYSPNVRALFCCI